MKTYRVKEILEMFPFLTQNRLVHWAEKGVITPVNTEDYGYGSVRKYEKRELIKMVAAHHLSLAGIPTLVIRKMCNPTHSNENHYWTARLYPVEIKIFMPEIKKQVRIAVRNFK